MVEAQTGRCRLLRVLGFDTTARDPSRSIAGSPGRRTSLDSYKARVDRFMARRAETVALAAGSSMTWREMWRGGENFGGYIAHERRWKCVDEGSGPGKD